MSSPIWATLHPSTTESITVHVWSWYTSLLVLLCTVLSIPTPGYLYILHPKFGYLIATSSKGVHITVAMMLILFYYVLLVFLYGQLHVCDSRSFHLKLSTGSILFPQHSLCIDLLTQFWCIIATTILISHICRWIISTIYTTVNTSLYLF